MNDNKGKITLVTAMFNCGRESHISQARSDNDYLSYFDFWAGINNSLVVYTSKEYKEAIYEIRARYGLEKKTTIIILDNLWDIEADLLNKMLYVEHSGTMNQIRIRQDDISNQATYDYLMLMKYWFCKDAVARGLTEHQVAWIDFGFNHGGEVLAYSEDFDFEWQYLFSDAIHLFARKNPNEEFGLLKIISMTDSIMGPIIVMPANLCEKLFDMCKEALDTLLLLGVFDDDQMLLWMAYKKYPELFEIHISDWFLPINEFGGTHIRVLDKSNCRGGRTNKKAYK